MLGIVKSTQKSKLSDEGVAFLRDPIMYKHIQKIATSVGVSAEEYLIRFEEVLKDSPHLIFNIFEKRESKEISH